MTTILIVDDDANSRALIHNLLRPEGYEVREAASAIEAMELVRSSGPDVIITELTTAAIDGIELCRSIRADARGRGTPIVVMTALDSRDDMTLALDAGATDFLSRPLSGIEVRARVRAMIRVSRSRQTLEQLLALRTDFTNMVIHDLRNPLQVISFSAEVLQKKLTEPSPPLMRIRAQVSRLQQLIDDLLVVARSDAGVLTAHVSEIDANELVQLVVEDCLPAAARLQISILTKIDVQCPFFADPALLRRCLENLVLNAIKFSPAKAKVTIDLLQQQQGLRIDVIDEGSGVPDGFRQSLFQPFVTLEQADPSVKQTGLGLAFCRMVAEAHGGTIAALASGGFGSIFRISIPGLSPATADNSRFEHAASRSAG
ncbi:MAG TPA: hybrid sensor histidine kinase/response regulator [Thermoanaerobaculia bacterium]|nr:hybrid sensor histidine kinase/response regulator [Thermoanaerobaculia bacterium]